MPEMTDTELLDWLQAQNDQGNSTGLCVFRWSTTGRGWRLHELGRRDVGHCLAFTDVRKAIEKAKEKIECRTK